MKIVIDLSAHEAIEDFTVTQPAGTYEFKSQDTIDWWLYFVRDGFVQDLGAGFATKFGMIVTGDATDTLLAYQTVNSHLTDADGNVYYLMQVNFNTSQMISAISGKTQLPCTIEIRYQTTDGEIVHTLNVPALVFPTILVETGTTPPSVPAGYPDPSTLELLAHKNANSGYAGLDSAGHIYPTQLGGVAELIANKNQPSGYAGLDSSTLLQVAQVPIDNSTIVITSGKLSAPLAGGDMRKSIYDTNNDGIVDHAALADTATNATNASTASTLAQAGAVGTLSTVWGQDAAGNQKLFPAPNTTPKPDSIAVHLEAPTVKNYYLDCAAPCAYTITGFYAICASGSASISLLQNGTTIAGSALSVTSTISSVALSIAIAQNDKIQLAVTAVSTAADLAISVRIQK